jgi:hypothetical protein
VVAFQPKLNADGRPAVPEVGVVLVNGAGKAAVLKDHVTLSAYTLQVELAQARARQW